jgi:hypothetical protein
LDNLGIVADRSTTLGQRQAQSNLLGTTKALAKESPCCAVASVVLAITSGNMQNITLGAATWPLDTFDLLTVFTAAITRSGHAVEAPAADS